MRKIFFFFVFYITIFNCQCQIQNLKQEKFRVIGLGEASHGDLESYVARSKILNGFMSDTSPRPAILIEMPVSRSYQIDLYLNNEIDSTELIKTIGYFGLQTSTFLTFVNTHREYLYYGVDLEHNVSLVKHLKKIIEKMIPKEATALDNCFFQLQQNYTFLFQDTGSIDSNKQMILSNINDLEAFLTLRRDKIGDESFFKKYIYSSLKGLKQYLEYTVIDSQIGPNASYVFRDSCMAANIIDIEERIRIPCVFLGANAHVCKAENKCGYFLGKHYKEKYFAVGHQFYEGQILTVKFEGSGDKIQRKIVTLDFKALKKSLPYYLSKFGVQGYVSQETSVSKKLRHQLRKQQWILDIGATLNMDNKYVNYRYARFYDLFDALYFDKIVHASTNLNQINNEINE